MAHPLSPTLVVGKYGALYEELFSKVESTNGNVSAMNAAKFLKRSNLSDKILSKIWDLSDSNGKGHLTKLEFFIALKFVALVQKGYEVSVSNLSQDIPPPDMGNVPPPLPTASPAAVPLSDWSMKPLEKAKYDQLFDSLQPVAGVIPGNKVKGLLVDSKLPLTTLQKIWDLADMDKDGSLNRHEFCVAMHLVYKILEKHAIPSCLPPELLPPALEKRKPSLGGFSDEPPPPPPTTETWVVSPQEKARFDDLFVKADLDMDGFVSGNEIKNLFLQSGLSQVTLANIWSLCDVKQAGKLNSEQFALAMWLIQRKVSQNIDPPDTLTPDMIPPCLRAKPAPARPPAALTPRITPEMELLIKEIEQFEKERFLHDSEVTKKEADIKVKALEVKSLKEELNTLLATLKQLESQKVEADRRLHDLKNQRANREKELGEIAQTVEAEQKHIERLRKQAS